MIIKNEQCRHFRYKTNNIEFLEVFGKIAYYHLPFRNLPFHNFFHNKLYWLIEKLSVDNLNNTKQLEKYWLFKSISKLNNISSIDARLFDICNAS